MPSRKYKLLRRMLHIQHMDFEYALWQMLYLCTQPSRVYVCMCGMHAFIPNPMSYRYRNFNFNKRLSCVFRVRMSVTRHSGTKNQWARDDPAFMVLLSLFLARMHAIMASITRLLVFTRSLGFMIWVVFSETRRHARDAYK